MATDLVSIYNEALSHVGVGTEVQSATENSAGANACRRFYTPALTRTLEDFNWPFAKIRAVLALVESEPNPEWWYSYRYPSDCVAARRIVSATLYLRNAGPAQIIPYAIESDSEGKLIFCDLVDASLEYTKLVDDPSLFSGAFADAVGFRLAYLIAPRVTGGDPSGLGSKAFQLYQREISMAQANALNEEQPDEPPDAEWISDRA